MSLVHVLDSPLSGHSLLQLIPWSTIIRQPSEYNANSLPWHPRSSRTWPNQILILLDQGKHILLHVVTHLARIGFQKQMPSVTAAICPVFALKAKVDDQLVHLPRFFTWIIHRLLSDSGLAIIIQRTKQLPMH